ncbi:hypothetical protein BHM03_00018755, partial [Ensete ventricosum]
VQSTRAMEREEPSSSRLVVAAAVLLLLIEPPVSSLSDEGPFPPPLPPPCLNPTFHDRDSAQAMEREEPSSSHLVVAAAVLLLLIAPPISPLSDEGSFRPPLPLVPPPCLNPTFHDRDNVIVAWYNPSARPKRPAPGLGRVPRRRHFEARRLEIERGTRASPRPSA